MKDTRFGVEIEMTGITRQRACRVIQSIVGGTVEHTGTYYDTWTCIAEDGRKWKTMYDGSIYTSGNRLTSCEVVTPILTYANDMNTLQEVVRALRKAGAVVNNSCGLHIHVDGSSHTPKTLRNMINIVNRRCELFYQALGVPAGRKYKWCKPLNENFIKEVNEKRPRDFQTIEDAWYEESSYQSRDTHYNQSRYHFLNLHAYFHGHGTLEFRCFNSTLHAGEVRAYVAFVLALNDSALNVRTVSTKIPEVHNGKQEMKNFLRSIGLGTDEFKNCIEHLTKGFISEAQRQTA